MQHILGREGDCGIAIVPFRVSSKTLQMTWIVAWFGTWLYRTACTPTLPTYIVMSKQGLEAWQFIIIMIVIIVSFFYWCRHGATLLLLTKPPNIHSITFVSSAVAWSRISQSWVGADWPTPTRLLHPCNQRLCRAQRSRQRRFVCASISI